MDKLDMAIALLQEAREEKRKLAQYEAESAKLPRYDEPNHRSALEAFWKKWPKVPYKSVVNDNIKMARRLLVGEYMK